MFTFETWWRHHKHNNLKTMECHWKQFREVGHAILCMKWHRRRVEKTSKWMSIQSRWVLLCGCQLKHVWTCQVGCQTVNLGAVKICLNKLAVHKCDMLWALTVFIPKNYACLLSCFPHQMYNRCTSHGHNVGWQKLSKFSSLVVFGAVTLYAMKTRSTLSS